MNSRSLNLTRGLEVKGKYSNIDHLYGPYTSLEQACQRVDQRIRKVGLTVGIIKNGSVVEYWWRDATDDNSLILKNPSKEKVEELEGEIQNVKSDLEETKEKIQTLEDSMDPDYIHTDTNFT